MLNPHGWQGGPGCRQEACSSPRGSPLLECPRRMVPRFSQSKGFKDQGRTYLKKSSFSSSFRIHVPSSPSYSVVLQPSSDLTLEETTRECENQEVKVTLGATLETGCYTHHFSPDLWQRWAWGTGDPWSRIGPWWWQGKDQGLEPCCECHTPQERCLGAGSPGADASR